MNQTVVAVSTRTRNGFTYQAHSPHPTRLDALDAAFRLREAGRFAYTQQVRREVTFPGGETVAVGWAVWVEAPPVEQGRAVAFSIAPDCSLPTKIVIHDADGNVIPPGLESARAIGRAMRQIGQGGKMTNAQFEALDAQEQEARAAQQAEANFKRYGRR